MNKKISNIFSKELNREERIICSNVLIQSSILFFGLLIGGSLLSNNIKIFEIFQICDVALLSLALGYGYFAIKVAWKGVDYDKKNTNKYLTCISLTFLSILMIVMSYLYWQIDVFLYDPQRIHFGIFIISGTLITIFYTFSIWIHWKQNHK